MLDYNKIQGQGASQGVNLAAASRSRKYSDGGEVLRAAQSGVEANLGNPAFYEQLDQTSIGKEPEMPVQNPYNPQAVAAAAATPQQTNQVVSNAPDLAQLQAQQQMAQPEPAPMPEVPQPINKGYIQQQMQMNPALAQFIASQKQQPQTPVQPLQPQVDHEKEALRSQVGKYEEQIAALGRELDSVKIQFESYAQNAEGQLKVHTDAISERDNAINAWIQKSTQLETQLVELHNQHAQLTSEVEESEEGELDEIYKGLTSLSKQITELEQVLATQNGRILEETQKGVGVGLALGQRMRDYAKVGLAVAALLAIGGAVLLGVNINTQNRIDSVQELVSE